MGELFNPRDTTELTLHSPEWISSILVSLEDVITNYFIE